MKKNLSSNKGGSGQESGVEPNRGEMSADLIGGAKTPIINHEIFSQ